MSWAREHLFDPADFADAFDRLDAEELAETVPAYCPDCGSWVCGCLDEEPDDLRKYGYRSRWVDVRTDLV